MALPLFPALAAAVSALFFRRASSDDARHDNGAGGGDAPRRTRPVPALLFSVTAFLLIYHFLVWPLLNHHFPEYGFPPIDLAALGAALAAMGNV